MKTTEQFMQRFNSVIEKYELVEIAFAQYMMLILPQIVKESEKIGIPSAEMLCAMTFNELQNYHTIAGNAMLKKNLGINSYNFAVTDDKMCLFIENPNITAATFELVGPLFDHVNNTLQITRKECDIIMAALSKFKN